MPDWTKGDWRPVNRGTPDNPVMVVSAVLVAGEEPARDLAMCSVENLPPAEEMANAVLFAAAKELALALQHAIAWRHNPQEWVGRAIEALKKAGI